MSWSGSIQKIGKDTLYGAGFGALGGAAGRALGSAVSKRLTNHILSSKRLSALAGKLTRSSNKMNGLFRKLADKEIAALAKSGKNFSQSQVSAAYNKLAEATVARVVTRIGFGGINKVVASKTKKPIEDFVKAKALSIQGSISENTLAELIADEIANSPAMAQAFEQVAFSNVKLLCDEMSAAIRSHIEAELKAQPAS